MYDGSGMWWIQWFGKVCVNYKPRRSKQDPRDNKNDCSTNNGFGCLLSNHEKGKCVIRHVSMDRFVLDMILCFVVNEDGPSDFPSLSANEFGM